MTPLLTPVSCPAGSVLCMLLLCLAAGWMAEQIRLPPLLGMLLMGLCLANLPGLRAVSDAIPKTTSSLLR